MNELKRMILGLALLCASLNAGAVQPLEMDNAIVIESESPELADQLVITGRNFDNGREVQLTLGGTPLEVVEHTANVILAEVPADVLPGSYVLIARSGGGSIREDSMDITMGAVGPEGPEGAEGAEGPQGPEDRIEGGLTVANSRFIDDVESRDCVLVIQAESPSLPDIDNNPSPVDCDATSEVDTSGIDVDIP